MKKNSKPTRAPLTTEELEKLTVDELRKTKLTEDEMVLLREINKRRDQERAIRAAKLLEEQAPLLAELQAVGLNIKAVWDLISMAENYEDAIPILLRHLQMPYSDPTRETIARALAVPEARYAWPILVAEYRKAPMGIGEYGFPRHAKDGLACALSATVTNDVIEELIEIAKDRTQGDSRILLLPGLRRSRNPLAKQALEELANDPDLAKEIASWRKRKR